MRHSSQFALGGLALILAAACADGPVAPHAATAVSPLGLSANAQAASPEYDWTLNKELVAILAGEHMIPEASTLQTTIVPGDVKWMHYRITATRTATAPGTGITKDASARLDEQIVQACMNAFPSIICTWGGDRAPSYFPVTLNESTTLDMIVDLHNFRVCGEEFPFVNRASLTELGPYARGAAAQVRTAQVGVLVKTGACPPKPANPGCTYTLGYWKNHAWPVHPAFPPSTLDTWEADNGWSGTPWYFFDTRLRWRTVLGTPPRGDAYYILAHQYIAAILNQQNGAYVPENVRMALMYSYRYFSMSPTERAAVSRAQLTSTASLLDAYNNGRLGVPHCG